RIFERLALQIRVGRRPPCRLHDLDRIGRSHEYLRKQGIGIKRNRGDQLLQLLATQALVAALRVPLRRGYCQEEHKPHPYLLDQFAAGSRQSACFAQVMSHERLPRFRRGTNDCGRSALPLIRRAAQHGARVAPWYAWSSSLRILGRACHVQVASELIPSKVTTRYCTEGQYWP